MQAFLTVLGSPSPSPFLTVVSLGLLGQLGLVHVVLALGHGPDVDASSSHALADGRGGLQTLLAIGGDPLLVTAHVADELETRGRRKTEVVVAATGRGRKEGRTSERESSQQEKCGGEAVSPNDGTNKPI